MKHFSSILDSCLRMKIVMFSSRTCSLTPWSRVLPEKLTNKSSAAQEIPCILCNLKAYYRIHKSPPPDRFRRHNDPAYAPHPISRRSVLILSSHLRLRFPGGLIPPWRWGRSWSSKRRNILIYWHGCSPEKTSQNLVAVKTSRQISDSKLFVPQLLRMKVEI